MVTKVGDGHWLVAVGALDRGQNLGDAPAVGRGDGERRHNERRG